MSKEEGAKEGAFLPQGNRDSYLQSDVLLQTSIWSLVTNLTPLLWGYPLREAKLRQIHKIKDQMI